MPRAKYVKTLLKPGSDGKQESLSRRDVHCGENIDVT